VARRERCWEEGVAPSHDCRRYCVEHHLIGHTVEPLCETRHRLRVELHLVLAVIMLWNSHRRRDRSYNDATSAANVSRDGFSSPASNAAAQRESADAAIRLLQLLMSPEDGVLVIDRETVHDTFGERTILAYGHRLVETMAVSTSSSEWKYRRRNRR